MPFLNLLAAVADRAGRVRVRVGGNTQETATLVNSLPNNTMIAKDKTDATNPVRFFFPFSLKLSPQTYWDLPAAWLYAAVLHVYAVCMLPWQLEFYFVPSSFSRIANSILYDPFVSTMKHRGNNRAFGSCASFACPESIRRSGASAIL